MNAWPKVAASAVEGNCFHTIETAGSGLAPEKNGAAAFDLASSSTSDSTAARAEARAEATVVACSGLMEGNC